MTDLGTLGGANSQANALNARGEVTGSADVAGDEPAHAFLYRSRSGMLDLNKLLATEVTATGFRLTSGVSIDDHGVIRAEANDGRSYWMTPRAAAAVAVATP